MRRYTTSPDSIPATLVSGRRSGWHHLVDGWPAIIYCSLFSPAGSVYLNSERMKEIVLSKSLSNRGAYISAIWI